MSRRYRGPLAWLRQWNFRRVEERRWRRELLEALADDDGAIMEALTRLLEQGRTEALARAEGQSALALRVEVVLGDVDRRLAELDRRVAEQGARLEALLAKRGA